MGLKNKYNIHSDMNLKIKAINAKTMMLLFTVFMMLITFVIADSGLADNPEINVTVNGQAVAFTEAQPIIYNGRTMMPAKAIFESMGAIYSWDEETQTASVVKGDTTMFIPADSVSPTINGAVTQLDAPTIIVDGTLFVPLRFISEAFGAAVNWEADTRTVSIMLPDSGGGESGSSSGGGGGTSPPVPIGVTFISPNAGTINKSCPADTVLSITWGTATRVTKMLAGSPAFGLTYDPHEGVDYTVSDNGNGTGIFVIKKELANQLPVPLNMVPAGAEMAITILFDNGAACDFVLTVVDGVNVTDPYISPVSVELFKNNLINIPINITWNAAGKITGINATIFGDTTIISLREGIEYTISGRILALKSSEIMTLLPMPLSNIPDGELLTLTIIFDQGERTFNIRLRDPQCVNSYFVAIDNSNNALPQSGINEAEIIYEMAVAPGITRYLAAYDPYKEVEEIGPVRSARSSFLDIALGHKSAFAHCGGSADALYRLPADNLINLDEIYGSAAFFYRLYDRAAPHNLYTNSQLINDGIVQKGAQVNNHYSQFPVGEMPGGKAFTSAVVKYYGQYQTTEFKWNSAIQQYEKYFNGKRLVQKNGNSIRTNNVIVIYTQHEAKYAGENVVQPELIGSGRAAFYRDGKQWVGTWAKNSENDSFVFKANDEKMYFSPGNMWVLIAEEDRSSELSDLIVSAGIISPYFSPEISNYSVKLPPGYAGAIPEVTVLTADPAATVSINKATSLTGLGAERTATIIVTSAKGNYRSYEVTFTIAKDYFAKTLIPGWNTLSIPLELDKKRFIDIVDEIQKVELAYVYDSNQAKWIEINSAYTFKPMDAICLKANDVTGIKLIPAKELTGGYTRLLKAGWNFFGPALDISHLPALMPVGEVLFSINGNYSQVISPAMGNQTAWGYAPSMNLNPVMRVGEGYWIYLQQNATLAGYSYTPIEEVAENQVGVIGTLPPVGSGGGSAGSYSSDFEQMSLDAYAVAEVVDSDIPALPAAFYGTVTDQNGNNISEGTIEVVVNGVVRAKKDFVNGKFGLSLGERLIVEKALVSGVDNIGFLINDLPAYTEIPVEWEESFGNLNSLHLKVDMSGNAVFSFQAVRPLSNTSVELIFNKALDPNLINNTSFRDAISFAANGTDFIPLNSEAEITIKDNKLIIVFSQPLAGDDNKIKIQGGIVRDTDNKIIADSITTAVFSAQGIDECFIATAAFGSKFEPAVVLLRLFRDRFLLTNKPGIAFVDFYYRNSPSVAAHIAYSEPLKVLVRVLLTPVIVAAYSILHPLVGAICIVSLGLMWLIRKRKRKSIV